MIVKALGYLCLSVLVLILAPVYAFFMGLDWGLEGNFSFKGYVVCICRIIFYDPDGNLRAAFRKELLLD